MTTAAEVWVIDDDDAVLNSFVALLETAGYRVTGFPSPAAFFEAERRDIDCLIMDLKLPGITGIELQRRLAEEDFTPPIIIVTAFGDVDSAVEAMKLGAVDFVKKPFDDEAILAVVAAAIERGRNVREKTALERDARQRLASLSKREREVLLHVALGSPSKNIAHDLDISRRTVEIHRTNIMRKANVHNLAELVRLAHLAGFARGPLRP